MKICCVTGHRPEKFPWNYYDCESQQHTEYLEAMACKVVEFIDEGYDTFLCGGANGVDLDFADIVIGLRDSYCPHISLEIVVPYDEQNKGWCKEDKSRYLKALSLADTVTYTQHEYSQGCMNKRNEYMVDKSNTVLAFWNGTECGGTWNTMQYAKKQQKRLVISLLSASSKLVS